MLPPISPYLVHRVFKGSTCAGCYLSLSLRFYSHPLLSFAPFLMNVVSPEFFSVFLMNTTQNTNEPSSFELGKKKPVHQHFWSSSQWKKIEDCRSMTWKWREYSKSTALLCRFLKNFFSRSNFTTSLCFKRSHLVNGHNDCTYLKKRRLLWELK